MHLLISLLFMAGLAQAGPPGASIDLSVELALKPRKDFGRTCHVSAAVALFEASCLRVTKKPVSISEAGVFLEHLMKELSLEENRRVLFNDPKSGALTPLDGGDEAQDLLRVVDGADVRTRPHEEREKFLMKRISDLFRQAEAEADDSISGYKYGGALLGLTLGSLISQLTSKAYDRHEIATAPANQCLWQRIAPFVPPVVGSLGGKVLGGMVGRQVQNQEDLNRRLIGRLRTEGGLLLANQNQSPELIECLKAQLRPYQAQSPGIAWMRRMLDAKIPFLCGGVFDGDRQVVSTYRAKDVGHVGMVVGYQADPLAPNGVRFLIQNGDGQMPQLWSVPIAGCPDVTALLQPSEPGLYGPTLTPVVAR